MATHCCSLHSHPGHGSKEEACNHAHAPSGPAIRVRIEDHSGAMAKGEEELIGNFRNSEHAGAFMRAYLRDSIENSRPGSGDVEETRRNWEAFGEEPVLLGSEKGEQRIAREELAQFLERRASFLERDWRTLDPRRPVNAALDELDDSLIRGTLSEEELEAEEEAEFRDFLKGIGPEK